MIYITEKGKRECYIELNRCISLGGTARKGDRETGSAPEIRTRAWIIEKGGTSMIINMPANSFFLYYVGYLGQAIFVIAAGIYLYNKDSKSNR